MNTDHEVIPVVRIFLFLFIGNAVLGLLMWSDWTTVGRFEFIFSMGFMVVFGIVWLCISRLARHKAEAEHDASKTPRS
jgi:hypothetical protein